MEPGRQNTIDLDLRPGSLLARTKAQVARALRVGALETQQADVAIVVDNELPFVVWRMGNMHRKQRRKPRPANGKPFNPFLPYDPNLFVADLSPTHLALLNKYNMYANHLLLVSRAFVPQTSWLTVADFAALWGCLGEIDGLGFYNGGKGAGGSQPHRHLQLVPLPLSPDGTAVPTEQAINNAVFVDGVGRSPSFPFAHAIARLVPGETAVSLFAWYRELLTAVGLNDGTVSQGGTQTAPYNLLMTRRWLLIVPRTQGKYRGLSVNSLGFAGSLLARNDEELALIEEIGPLGLLGGVGLVGK